MVEAQSALTTIDARIDSVRQRIKQAATAVGRDSQEITIVAVTKTVERKAVDAAYAAGLRHFGENRVQDARWKFSSPLPDDATLHMIGQLQSNKAKQALRLFHMVESVDRPSLVNALAKQAASIESAVPILLQVNVVREPQKAGCDPTEAAGLVDLIRAHPRLQLRGLMTIAPLVIDAEETRPVFRELRCLRDRLEESVPGLRLPILSMGMTNDFPIAIEEGATHIRVGRAIFG